MTDWYARKLAALRGTQPPAAQPNPGVLPAHLAPYAPQQPVAPQVAPPPQAQQQFTTYDANTGAQVADDGTIAALVNAARGGGSNAVKSNSTTCPNCGGGNYFTIPEGGVMSRAAGTRVQAMQCADCNYPKVQAGSQGGALQSARSSGPSKTARQLPAGHRVTVVGEGGQSVSFNYGT